MLCIFDNFFATEMAAKCSKCEIQFTKRSNLNRHLKSTHGIAINAPGSYKCMEGCNVSFATNVNLCNHLVEHHGFANEISEMIFSTLDEFNTWLTDEEKRENVQYVIKSTVRNIDSGQREKIYLECSRSGAARKIEDGERKRSTKSKGSSKINLKCTSKIIVHKCIESGEFSIKYYKQHYGHDKELEHLRIQKRDRESIASKLGSGITPKRILDTTREDIEGVSKRIDILTRQDISNIKRSYCLDLRDGCRYKDVLNKGLKYKQAVDAEVPIIIRLTLGLEEDNAVHFTMIPAYTLHCLSTGYSRNIGDGNEMEANCSCSLLMGSKNIIVDTMTAWDSKYILKSLEELNLSADDISYVISTHGHSDHIGNNNLFLKATHIVGFSISHRTKYFSHPFSEGTPYHIDSGILVIPTPGHTMEDVTVIAYTKNFGLVALAGDLFEHCDDVLDSSLWIDAGSNSPDLQKKHRFAVANIVDNIVPGHGPVFEVTDEIRRVLAEQLK